MEVGRGLAQAELDVAQLVACPLQLRCEPFERRDRALRERDETGGALAVVGSKSGGGLGSTGGELGDVPVPLALGPQLLLLPWLHAVGVLDQRAQLRKPSLGVRRVGRQLVVPAAGRLELAPRHPRRGAPGELLLAAEAVEHLELVGGPRQPALLELARHRDDALDGGRDVLPCSRASPRIGARAAVGEDPAGDDERVLVLRPQLRELFELLREIELRLDVGLLAGGPDVRVVALRAEQEAERLGEDRLAGTRLSRDRVQPGRELELGLADEDEVLDAEPVKHAAIVDPRRDAAHSLFRT